LRHVPTMRLFNEFMKLFFEGEASSTYQKLCHYDYFSILFPDASRVLALSSSEPYKAFVSMAMKNMDSRFLEGKLNNPAFLLAVLLWPVLQDYLKEKGKRFRHFSQSLHHGMLEVLKIDKNLIVIPKKMAATIKSIWLLQYYLVAKRESRIKRILQHRYFRAAYDFLILRAKAQEDDLLQERVSFWESLPLRFKDGEC
jgi:poly(A) polymerase